MDKLNTDVLIIGAGAAGIRAALSASQAGSEVVMVVKGELTQSGSTFSTLSEGWGIQALVGEERTDKNLEDFYEDIIRVGLGMCDPKLVRILVEESGPRLEDLIVYGIRFRKDSQGNYIRVRGCFSDYKRAFLTEDTKNIKQSFLSIIKQSSVKIIRGQAISLITADDACWGACILTKSHEIVQINAKSTILATGGGAGIFMDHFVDDDAVGDGYALAHRAGAELTNLEFIQFILGLKRDGLRLFLPLPDLDKRRMIRDSEGHDLLEEHMPDPKIRAKAVDERQRHVPFSCRDSSYLVDIAVAQAHKEGRKVFWGGGEPNDCPEVAHFSRAFNGGVKINEIAESTIPGLFAAGEAAAGPHGADRIGGCMMSATQVFGERAGRFGALRANTINILPDIKDIPEDIKRVKCQRGFKDQVKRLNHIKTEAKDIISRNLMVLRDEKGIQECLRAIEMLFLSLEKNAIGNAREYFQIKNLLLVGKLIALSALMRKESLGSHYMSDRC